jgi:type I restriction enzyme S subunit
MEELRTLNDVLVDAKVFTDGDWVESKDQDPDGDVRLIQLADVGDGFFIDKSNRFMTTAKAKALGCTFLAPGDLLVARMPDPLGRCCIFPGDEKPCVTVVDVCVIRPCQRKVFPRWLMHCINAPITRHKISGYITGTTRQRISRGNLGTVTIPLPPLSEQKRIAEILDGAEALRAKRRAALALFDELTQSIFLDMFGDPVTNPKGWDFKKFCDLGSLDRGISKNRPRNSPHLLGGIHPLIQTGDIASSGGYIRKHVSTYSDAGLQQSKKWPSGTLCITIAANIAKTGILKFEACFPDSVVGFKSDPATVEYVRVWLSFLQKTLEDSAPESAQKNINLATLRGLPVPTPPLRLREDFASRINALEALKSKARFGYEHLDQLFASLQHRAFRGEL